MNAPLTGERARVSLEQLRVFVEKIFGKVGMPEHDAAILADHLLWADARGAARLGVAKIPGFVARIRAGGTRAAADIVVLEERPGFVVVDGQDALGQIVGVKAMRLAVARAGEMGIAAVAAQRTTSGGALGYLASVAADQGMIGFAVNNSPPLQAAWGGTTKVIGNQAFAVASPAGRHDALVIDMATSAMSLVGIEAAHERGEQLRPGVAVGPDGVPTTDPEAALAGTLLPMGDHRGYGLSVLWEVLTGVLSGGDRFAGDLSMAEPDDRPRSTSIFVFAIDPGAAMAPLQFTARVDRLIDQMHACPPEVAGEPVRVPGEGGAARAAAHRRDGVLLPPALVANLTALGEELGVPWST